MPEGLRKALQWLPVGWTINDILFSFRRVETRHVCPSDSQPRQVTVVIDKASCKIGNNYVRGDIVSLKSPTTPPEKVVARLIAVEGDWVSSMETGKIQKIPRGFCCVESNDGNQLGRPVPMALIEGKVGRICWPLSCFGRTFELGDRKSLNRIVLKAAK